MMILYLLINSLFIVKYGLRFTSWYAIVPACIIYCGAVFLTVRYLFPRLQAVSKKTFLLIVAAFVLLLAIAQSMVDPLTLQVDRWSAIHYFLDNLTAGVYPYAAQTHLGGYGSPFPVWQLFHLPFYFLNNVGLSFIGGIALFAHSLTLYAGRSRALTAVILLVLSPSFLYEVMVRSDVTTNFLVSFSILLYCIHYELKIEKNAIALGIITGLMMSTRLSAVIPFCIYYFYEWCHTSLRQQLTFATTLLLTFCATLLPFLLWDFESMVFFEYNPFVLQTRQGEMTDLILLIPIGMFLSFWQHGQKDRHFTANAIMLILLVAISFLHTMFLYHLWTELFQSHFDITYFNMSVPFLCAVLAVGAVHNRINNLTTTVQ